MTGRVWVRALVAALLLTGTASIASATTPHRDTCRDPHPCGDLWPKGLHGPFALKEVRNVQVKAHDGVLLDGWIATPDVPPGVRTPTVLVDTPYIDVAQQATVTRNPSSPRLPTCDLPLNLACGYWDEHATHAVTSNTFLSFPPVHLVHQGYTVALFSVRGTGSSGGCLQMGGRDEQRDQVTLVDFLARQAGSNGRVGMGGLSYPSWTTWEAAVQAPPALKAIVTGGDLVSWYQLLHSPQGSADPYWSAYFTDYEAEMGLKSGVTSERPVWVQRETCPQANVARSEAASLTSGERDAAYWQERELLRRLPAVRAAVLSTEGYHDLAHAYQSDNVWGSLDRRTPRVQLGGWWAHEMPDPGNGPGTRLDFPSGEVDWEGLVTRWFDHWLKGDGPEPREVAYHQDQDKRWHEASSWPARPNGKQVLYLDGSALSGAVRPGSTSFRSVPSADSSWGQFAFDADPVKLGQSLCPDVLGAGLGRAYVTKPLQQRVLLAGNVMAYLKVSTDQPGGLVTATLFDVGPDFTCAGGVVAGARWLSSGSADLAHYDSPFALRSAPVGTTVPLRVDLTDLTYSLAPGHRLALTLSHGETWEHGGSRVYPTITVLGDSHLVLPVEQGTLGGKAPTLRYPHRPFTPPTYRD